MEKILKEYLDGTNILIINNVGFPLEIALKLLGNGGEVIATQVSGVATN